MLDLTGMSQEQQDAFIHTLEAAADNPIEQMKMNFLLRAIELKEWIEKNTLVNKKELQILWDGLENAVTRDFQQAQKELSIKLGIPLIE
jgi:hypothetical protein